MTRDGAEPGHDPERDGPEHDRPEEPSGSLRPTTPLTLVGWALVGLVLGWAVRPVWDRLDAVPPLVTAAQPLALLLLAAILAYVAWSTYRAVHVRRERLQSHQAVNRLVLARASALVGALVAGGYAGYALTWIREPAQRADGRLMGSAVAAGCALAATVAAVLLERACRVRRL